MIDPSQIKSDNIARLQSWGIPVNDFLPTLEAEDELSPPVAADVARRAMVVSHIIGIGFGGDPDNLRGCVEKFGLWSHASAYERDLLSRTNHGEQERIDATWLIECMQSFAWCLGLAPLRHFNPCDGDLAGKFPAPYTDPSAFIATAELRPFEEIYREADLHFRLHWAARNARLTGQEFPVPEGLVAERRKALDWVIGVTADWDQVPDDT